MLQFNLFPVNADDLVVLPELALPQRGCNTCFALQALAAAPYAHVAIFRRASGLASVRFPSRQG